MSTNYDLVLAIRNSSDLLGIPHSKLDCQAAVEKALKLVGVNVNYRGSNHMWREMVTDRAMIDIYREAHGGLLTPGLICFTLKNDGSEVARGYHDNMGAAVHVGIILDDTTVFHSGKNGSEICSLAQTTFNRVAFCKHIEYIDVDNTSTLRARLDDIIATLDTIRIELEELKNDTY